MTFSSIFERHHATKCVRFCAKESLCSQLCFSFPRKNNFQPNRSNCIFQTRILGMRVILLTLASCAIALGTDHGRMREPETAGNLRSSPKVLKSTQGFHFLRLLRRVIDAESEFALKLSSLGIHQSLEVGRSDVPFHAKPVTEASTSMPQEGRPQGPAQ